MNVKMLLSKETKPITSYFYCLLNDSAQRCVASFIFCSKRNKPRVSSKSKTKEQKQKQKNKNEFFRVATYSCLC